MSNPFDRFNQMLDDLRQWVWIKCPFCDSNSLPLRKSAGAGGWTEQIILECPECNRSQKFITDWSPVIHTPLVNEAPEFVQGDYCEYLSIQKKEDHILFRCTARSPRNCFGRSPDGCYSYHHNKLHEFWKNGEMIQAIEEAEKTIELFRIENPQISYPSGTSQLLELQYRVLPRNEWLNWVENKIRKLESEHIGIAASLAFSVAETFGESSFWKKSINLYNRYRRQLKSKLDTDIWGFERTSISREYIRAEIMILESRSEIEIGKRSELLMQSGNKWLELYKESGSPFSHRDFLLYTFYLKNLALANPATASEQYKEAYNFLMDKVDILEFESEKVYYRGHANYFLGKYYFNEANKADDEEEIISLLLKAINTFKDSIELHKIINLESLNVNILVNFIEVILCVEYFENENDYEFIEKAEYHLIEANKYIIPSKIIDIVDTLINIYKQVYSIEEFPEKSLKIMSRARTKKKELLRTLSQFRISDMPIQRRLEANINYLDVFLDVIQNNVKSLPFKRVNYNNIKKSLISFKESTERQYYTAIRINGKSYENNGRTLIQTHLCATFPNRTFQFREVMVAKGKSDNLLILDGEKYPFEVKIWRGRDRYNIGLKQIKYYMHYENVSYGFYIIFDPRSRDYRSDTEIIKYDSKEIFQLFIHINPKSPQDSDVNA